MLQKVLLELFCNIPWESSINPVLINHNLLSLSNINKYQVHTLFFTICLIIIVFASLIYESVELN